RNNSGAPWPSGVTAPMPVMTTRRRMSTALPPAADDRRALAHVGEPHLQEVRPDDRPGTAHDLDGASGVRLLVVQGRGQGTVAQGEQAGGNLDQAAAG